MSYARGLQIVAVLFGLAAIGFWSMPATLAGFITGNDLQRACLSRDNMCVGFIGGIADAMGAGNIINGYRACLPAGVELGQVKDIVIQYLNANTQTRHLSAGGLVADAISNAFPCR